MPTTARAIAKRDIGHANRRRHPRVPVGLPVEVHLSGRLAPLTVELSDIAAGGVRFRAPANDVILGQRARFMFVVEGSGACAAEGPITRINAGGEFIVQLDKTSPAFRAFVSSLAV
ncbi:MAG TPA: PilZ domain-containing protein [Polyangia bacterium]|nr:PilZ domain-containing protein [Polyangia bacterium]